MVDVTSRINVDHPFQPIDWEFLRHNNVDITKERRVDRVQINRTQLASAKI